MLFQGDSYVINQSIKAQMTQYLSQLRYRGVQLSQGRLQALTLQGASSSSGAQLLQLSLDACRGLLHARMPRS